MIFPSAAIQEARRELAAKLESGVEPSSADLERALAADPHGFVPLLLSARGLEREKNLPGAEEMTRRAMRSHPCAYHFPVLLSGILGERGTDKAEASAWMELGIRKLLADPDSLDEKGLSNVPPEFADPDRLRRLADELSSRVAEEPPELTGRLVPYRLIHQLQEELGNQLARPLVEDILKHGSETGPLLLGVLRGLTEGYLPQGSEMMGEAALALLGEIAEPQSIPALVQFTIVDDKSLSDIAGWALHRVAELKPAETVAVFRDFDRRASGGERAAMAEVLAMMPETPGRIDAALALLENFQAVEEDERDEAFVVLATALLTVAGKAAPALIRQAATDLGKSLSEQGRRETDKLLRAYAADPSAFDFDGDAEPNSTVFDICCSDRMDAYEDEEEEDEDGEDGHVHGPDCGHAHASDAGPGRNDPCWCGSGKKYKKCHLEADETERRGTAEK